MARVPRAALEAADFVRVDYPPWNVLVALVDGASFAIEDSCNHAGASLAEGKRDGDCVLCPMHGYVFSLRTGELITPKRLCDAQRTFVTTTDGGDVLVWDTFKVDVITV